MKTLEAQVPDVLLSEVIELAAKQHTSVDQIVSLALNAQVSAWRTRESIASRAPCDASDDRSRLRSSGWRLP